MTKNRLEAFSDGVIAIIITIMVLELKIPHESTFAALEALAPVFLSYVFSFIFVGIYWVNHHHTLHTVVKVTSAMMWGNLVFLFFLSLIPFTTGWMGENHFAELPVAVYSLNLMLCAIGFYFAQTAIIAQAQNSELLQAIKKQEKKGMLSLALYAGAVVSAFYVPLVAGIIIFITAVIWIVPNRAIEKALKEEVTA